MRNPFWVNYHGRGSLTPDCYYCLCIFFFHKDFVWYVLWILCFNTLEVSLCTCLRSSVSHTHTHTLETWHVSRLHTDSYVKFNCAITINHVPWRLYFPNDVHSYFIAEACSLWSFYVYFMQFLMCSYVFML